MKTIRTYQCKCGEVFYEDDTVCVNCEEPIDKRKLRKIEMVEITKEIGVSVVSYEKLQEYFKVHSLRKRNKAR